MAQKRTVIAPSATCKTMAHKLRADGHQPGRQQRVTRSSWLDANNRTDQKEVACSSLLWMLIVSGQKYLCWHTPLGMPETVS